MDSLTQIVLGAAVGEAVLGKKAGNKAMLWGAVAGTIPDLDVLSKYFLDEVSALEVHRGITHSIVFSLLCAPIFAYFIKKHERLFLALFFVLLISVFFLLTKGIKHTLAIYRAYISFYNRIKQLMILRKNLNREIVHYNIYSIIFYFLGLKRLKKV